MRTKALPPRHPGHHVSPRSAKNKLEPELVFLVHLDALGALVVKKEVSV
jgi:hypothetical protein